MDKMFFYTLGKKRGGGGGGSAATTVDIMGEVQFIDFAATPGFGMTSIHTFGVDGFETFEIVEGENYTVVWNGVEYKVKAVDSGAFIPGSLLLGNGAPANLPGKDEPFAIGWTASAVTFFSFDGKTSNTARIYKTVFDNAEEPSVALDFTNGNQIIRPSEDGKLLDEVVIEKPDTLIPENVAEGIDIAGTIGTFKGGGGGSGSSGARLFRAVDYDGAIIAESHLDAGASVTLPEPPVHERLVFDGWSSPFEISGNSFTMPDHDVIIGANYHTASGTTELDVEFTAATGLSFSFASSSLTGMTSIDWGDGSKNTSLSHTYSSAGEYTIKIYGMTAIANRTSSTGSLVGSASGSPDYTIKRVFFGGNITSIGDYAFYYCRSIEAVSFCVGLNNIGSRAFNYCSPLKCAVIPVGMLALKNSFEGCYRMYNVVLPYGMTSITTFLSAFSQLEYFIVPDGVTSVDRSGSEYTVTNIRLPSSLNMIPYSCFYGSYALKEIVLPAGITLDGEAFLNAYNLAKVVFLGDVVGIGQKAFANDSCVKEFDFSACTRVPTLSNSSAFSGINELCKIKVPAGLLSSWKSATNWSTYANYMVGV